ncbi:MAG: hypothetical protein AAF416_18035 [Pseudomonadota bacterium]
MPLQNRVLPTGEIVAAAWRGRMMGNRGCLHHPDRTLGQARWRHANWVCCVTEFRGRHRLPMPPPGSRTIYTALFFWDEAAAFAAGHRPCAECRNADYRRFKAAWIAAGNDGVRAADLDRALHRARVDRSAQRRVSTDSPAKLPIGSFILAEGTAAVITEGATMRAWLEEGGYSTATPLPRGPVEILTPLPILKVFEAGYTPAIDRPLPA